MLARLRRRLSFANVVSLIALFVALGGTSYAALQLPRDSVGSAQIRDGAVASRDVRDGGLRARDFARGQLPRGAQGQPGAAGPAGASGASGAPGAAGSAGAKGDTGAPGPPVAFARVRADGSVDTARAQGVGAAQMTHPALGYYCLDGLPTAPRSVVANADVEQAGVAEVVQTGVAPTAGPCAGKQAVVYVAIDGADADAGFYLLLAY